MPEPLGPITGSIANGYSVMAGSNGGNSNSDGIHRFERLLAQQPGLPGQGHAVSAVAQVHFELAVHTQ
jgi:hypothetical protein